MEKYDFSERGWILTSKNRLGDDESCSSDVFFAKKKTSREISSTHVVKIISRINISLLKKEVLIQSFCSRYNITCNIEDWWYSSYGVIVSPYIGENIKEKIKTINKEELWILVKKILKIVLDLHQIMGIAHLDVARQNIVLDNKNNPFLIDFGLSEVLWGMEDKKRLYYIIEDYLGIIYIYTQGKVQDSKSKILEEIVVKLENGVKNGKSLSFLENKIIENIIKY